MLLFLPKHKFERKDMGYKKLDQELSFADLILKDSMDKNRCLKRLNDIHGAIDWKNIESVLMSHYVIGTSSEGADAYSPLLLFKCFLLQKWFHIDSDPELESQINDRISFKRFFDLSFGDPSPDHSTFSRFRKRLSENAMDLINSEILHQYENKA